MCLSFLLPLGGMSRRFFCFLSKTEELIPFSRYYLNNSFVMPYPFYNPSNYLGASVYAEVRFELETLGVLLSYDRTRILFQSPYSLV